MLSDPVAIVDEVVVGRLSFATQVDVASVAVAQRPLVAVPMASEAGRHLRQDRVRPRFRDLDVAANAVAARGQRMAAVVETQVGVSQIDGLADVRLSVALEAGPRVVRSRMTAEAVRLRRKTHGVGRRGRRHAGMALDTVDAMKDVCAVFERVGRRQLRAKPENAGASREAENGGQEDHHASGTQETDDKGRHRALPIPAGAVRATCSNDHDTRASALASYL